MHKPFFAVRLELCMLVIIAGFGACSPSEEGTPNAATTSQAPASTDDTPAPETAESPAETVPTEIPSTEEENTQVTSEEGESAPPDTAMASATAEFGDDALLEGLAPDGWNQGDIEHYNVATLYDKIDGRSELYMAYDVVGLSWTTFNKEGDSALFIDVFLYDMRNPTGAFGIYSVEREPGQPELEVGRDGYRTGSNYYYWKGKYYAYVQASEATDQTRDAGLDITQRLASRLDDSGGAVEGLEDIPTDGVIEDTIQYFKVDAMSLDFMSETFTAKYKSDGEPYKVFLTNRGSSGDAQSILEQYLGYFEKYGDDIEKRTIEGVEVAVADLGGGFYDAVFVKDSMVAGITAIQGKEQAFEAAGMFLAKLTG